MTRRRGSIAPPTDARPSWLVRLSLGNDPSRPGRRIRLNKTFPTKKDAERYLTEQLARVDLGDRPAVGATARLTLQEWIDEWAELWSGHLAPQTREKALQFIRLYVPPELRGRQLRNITAGHVQRMLQDLEARGLAPRTVHRAYRELRARLNDAVNHGRLTRNPIEGRRVKAPTLRRREGRTLQPAEAKRFLALCEENRFGVLWAVLLLTGMRPEEALALKWDDVTGDEVSIRRALVRTTGRGAELRETKTDRSRVVKLSPLASRLLARHRAAQAERRLALGAEYHGQGLVFASTFGAPLQWPATVERYFKPLRARLALQLAGKDDTPPAGVKGQRGAREAYAARVKGALALTGLDKFRAYDLRHSCATLMIEAGESPRTVQEVLGHSTVVMTLETYTHPSRDLLERAAGRLEEAIQGAETGLKIAR